MLPTAPSSLSSTLAAGGKVKLNWGKATDTETPQNGLTYNLRIGSTPGGNEVLAPMADLTTGLRRVPKLGNTNHYTSIGDYEITNLAPGTYYWSVQAVDGAFAGSAFAAEQQFTIANSEPVLTAIGNKTTSVGTALTFTATATDADLPAQALTYSLVNAPAGATINASTGEFSWTPTEAQAGTDYTFIVEVSDGSLTDQEQITVSVALVNSVIDELASKLVLYPNPANDKLHVLLPEKAKIAVFSILGKKLFEKELKAGEQQVLNVANLPKGQYLLHVSTHKGVIIKAFIKH